MAGIHPWVGAAVIAVCAAAAFTGGYLYWRGRGAGRVTTHLLSLAQTLLVAQVAIGLLLLADDHRAADQLHYAYGTMALGAALVPWFYAPEEGPRRLLWFAATTAVAGALAGLALCLGWIGVTRAQDYPTQPVKLVVPFPAGGGTDALARWFAKGLEAKFGQPFVVENRAGSGTTLGAGFVARAAPDGRAGPRGRLPVFRRPGSGARGFRLR